MTTPNCCSISVTPRYAVVTTGFTIQKYRVPGIELYGTDGTIQMIGEDWAPQGYELWRNADGGWQIYEDQSHWPWADGGAPPDRMHRAGTRGRSSRPSMPITCSKS